MGEKKIDEVHIPSKKIGRKRFVSKKWLLENYVSWSDKTLDRRIEEDDFPFHDDTGGKMFDLDSVDRWFKKRQGTA